MIAALPLLASLALGSGPPSVSEAVKDVVFEHVTDSRVIEIQLPFMHEPIVEWHLPSFPVTIAGHAVDLGPTKHVIFMWLASLLLVLVATLATRARGRSLVPRGVANLIEMAVLFVRDEIALKTMDEQTANAYLPYLLTAFFFIVFSAGLGLFPWTATSVGNLAVTGTLATLTFVLMQFSGVSHQGVSYFAHLVPAGVPWALWPLMFVIEILGMFTKSFALCIRLFANMIAGHIVIFFVLGLIFLIGSPLVAVASVPFAIGLYLLEIIIILIQAYIFTMLSALFIGMSAHAH